MSAYRAPGKLGLELLALAAVLAAACLVLLAFALIQGPTRSLSEPVPFEERGAFEYGGALGNDVYDGNLLTTRQPLFRKLSEQLPVAYHYQLRPLGSERALDGAHGTYAITAELRQGNGWVRALPLVPKAAFFGEGFEAKGVLDLAAMAEMIRQLERQTGYKAPTFRVRVVAEIEAMAGLAGQSIVRSHRQVLDFQLSELELRLDAEASTVEYTGGGDVSVLVAAPRTLAVPLTGMRIEYARIPGLTVLGLGVSVMLAIGVFGMAAGRHRGVPMHARIAQRYASSIVDVDGQSHPQDAVRVHDLARLFALADRLGTPVMHTPAPGERYYAIVDAVPMYFEVAQPLGRTRPGDDAPPADRPTLLRGRDHAA